MNVRRFTARTSREALVLVRQALGEDAVVLSTKPHPEGVEVLAMAPEGMRQIERMSASGAVPVVSAAAQRPAAPAQPAAQAPQAAAAKPAPAAAGSVDKDVEQLAMSTLSFQDYVRERMLRRREAAMKAEAAARMADAAADARLDPTLGAEPELSPLQARLAARTRGEAAVPSPARAAAPSVQPQATPRAQTHAQTHAQPQAQAPVHAPAHRATPPDTHAPSHGTMPAASPVARAPQRRDPPVLRDEIRLQSEIHVPSLAQVPVHDAYEAPPAAAPAAPADGGRSRRDQNDMMAELRSMKGLIEERFGALAFMEKLQRQPAHARLTQKLLDCGFSPALIRKLADSMGADVGDETAWAAAVLERNLITTENDPALEDQGGVYALIGATGVGKTTTTAKLAAAFATRYGAANLGLITLDAYRVGAHEQLRAYGRILGVPVHTAHDRASLEDLLELLSAKKMVLIDTAGMAQRDTRTRELLEMLSHRAIQKLVVVNAAAQGETIEDVLVAYRASQARGVILSKMDEAVKLGPALDALIRHRLGLVGVANGQRVPEDWHRLSANALVHRALRPNAGNAWRLDANDVNLVFTSTVHSAPPMSASQAAPAGSLHV